MRTISFINHGCAPAIAKEEYFYVVRDRLNLRAMIKTCKANFGYANHLTLCVRPKTFATKKHTRTKCNNAIGHGTLNIYFKRAETSLYKA
jgi:hypothetical protein